ncbi:MAG: NAD(P)/FAD-dependent oxidoreductase [Thermoanaerobaculaceae bacterium]
MGAATSGGCAASRVWDSVVVGAGPSGAITALHLARRGHQVALLDRAAFPREKVCGDGLISDSLRCLERAGSLDEVSRLAHQVNVGIVSSPSGIRVRVPGRYLTLRRVFLDDILRRNAVAAGAYFEKAAVRALRRVGNGLHEVLLAGGNPMRAKTVVLAVGAEASLLRSSGFKIRSDEGSAVALRMYIRSAAHLEAMLVSYDRSISPGYAWIFPVGPREYNIGCGVFRHRRRARDLDLRQALREFTQNVPEAIQVMAGRLDEGTKPRGGTIWSGLAGAEPVSSEGVLAVGEAIGTTLPMTGEGIGKAMESGELASEAVSAFLSTGREEDLLGYSRSVKTQLLPKYRGYLRAQRWLSVSWINDFFCRRALSSPRFADAVAGILTESADPSEVLSVRGVLHSFLK